MFIKNRTLFARIILGSLVLTTVSNSYAVNWGSLLNYAKRGLQNIRNGVSSRIAAVRRWPQNQLNRIGNHLEQRANNHIDNIGNHIENRVNRLENNVNDRINNIGNNIENRIHVASNNAQQKLDSFIWNSIFGVAALATTFFLVKYLWQIFNK